MSLHFFVAEPDQPLFRIPISVIHQLHSQTAALPDYAGKRIRVVEVYVFDDENGAPQEARRAWGSYLEFDERGVIPTQFLDQFHESAFYKLILDKPDEKVVSIEDRIKRRDLERRHEWTLTTEEWDMVALAALAHPRATKKVRSVKIKGPPEPKVSYETRVAFGKISEAIHKIFYAVYELDEPHLLGLQELIKDHVEEKRDHREIWRAVMTENVDALKLMEAKRTGSGDWIAVVEIMRWNEKGNEGTSIKSWEEKHPTREAALEAAKRLATENAHQMEMNCSLEARVESALEWVAEKEDVD